MDPSGVQAPGAVAVPRARPHRSATPPPATRRSPTRNAYPPRPPHGHGSSRACARTAVVGGRAEKKTEKKIIQKPSRCFTGDISHATPPWPRVRPRCRPPRAQRGGSSGGDDGGGGGVPSAIIQFSLHDIAIISRAGNILYFSGDVFFFSSSCGYLPPRRSHRR